MSSRIKITFLSDNWQCWFANSRATIDNVSYKSQAKFDNVVLLIPEPQWNSLVTIDSVYMVIYGNGLATLDKVALIIAL